VRQQASASDLVVVGPVFFEVFVPEVPRPAAGEERYVERIPIGLGGALNPASVASALGVSVTLMHPAGEGFLDHAIDRAVARMGIRSVTWPSSGEPFLSLVFSDSNDRAFLSSGDYGSIPDCPVVPRATWVHVGGIREALALPHRVREARAEGAFIAVSGCWCAESLDRLAGIRDTPWDLLVLNRKEAERAAGDPRRAPELLAGAARDIVVTDGANGSWGRFQGQRLEMTAEPTKVLDPTGAGDAFMAGLVVSRIRGMDALSGLAFAHKVAGRILGIRGGVVHDPGILSDLARMIHDVP
jgi:sugar/nucleoside kinase (ribokinase family)